MIRKKRLPVLLLIPLLSLFILKAFALPARNVEMIAPKDYSERVCSLISNSSKSIWVIIYSFRYYAEYPLSPSNLILQELIRAVKRGVDVRVLLDVCEWDEKHTEENRRTGAILSRNGIKVYYDKMDESTHAKAIVVDSRYTVVGSTNWTYHALTSNNEISVFIDSQELAKEIEMYIMKLIGIKD